MTIIDKIVLSNSAPENINVLWLKEASTGNTLYCFGDTGWEKIALTDLEILDILAEINAAKDAASTSELNAYDYDVSAGTHEVNAGISAFDASADRILALTAKTDSENIQSITEGLKNETEGFRDDAYAAQSATILGGIAFDASAPTPGKSGKYYLTTAGSIAWLSGGAASGLIGQEILVVFTTPTYTYTLLPITSNYVLKTENNYRAFTNSISANQFVKEIYLYGADINPAKVYYLELVCRQETTYGNGLFIKEADPDFSNSVYVISILHQTEASMSGVIEASMIGSDISVKMIVDWEAFGINTSTGETLKAVFNEMVYDLKYSPYIYANYNFDLTSLSVIDMINGSIIINALEVGDATYSSLPSIGTYVEVLQATPFNHVRIRACAEIDGTPVTIKILRSTTAPTDGTLTGYEELYSEVQIWDTDITNIKSIRLPEASQLQQGDYVIVVFSTLSAIKVHIREYTTDVAGRKGFLYCVNGLPVNAFTEIWFKGDDGGQYCLSEPEVSFESFATEEFYNSVELLKEKVDVLENPTIDIICPTVFSAVVGHELNIYYDTIIYGIDAGLHSPLGLFVDISCPTLLIATDHIAIRKERMWLILANLLTSDYIGSHPLYIKIWDLEHHLVASKTCSIDVISDTGLSVAKNVLIIGDSITANGALVPTITTDFTEMGGTVPTLIGTLGTTPSFHEGRPGWEFGTFITTGSPFFNDVSGLVDFAYYRDAQNMGTDKFDVVSIMLGGNDCLVSYLITPSETVTKAKTLIDAIIADAGAYNTKIILQIPPSDCNTISSWQVYDSAAYSRKQQFLANIWALRLALIEEFTKAEYSGIVYIGLALIGVDRYYGYENELVTSSARISVLETYHTNCVHPATAGYQQFGDGMFLLILSLLQ